MSEACVLYERKGRVARIILNRPKQLNAISEQLMEDLVTAVDQFNADPKARVAILCSNCPKGFSAGFDFYDAAGPPPTLESKREAIAVEIDVFKKLHYSPKPIICAIFGHCIGGGTMIALSCDMIVAAEDVNFGNSELTWGLNFSSEFPIEPYKMPQNLVKEFFFTGKMIHGAEGYRMGIFNRVVPKDQVDEEANKLALEVCQVSELSLKMFKQVINKTYDLQGFQHNVDYAAEMFALIRLNGMTEDGQKFYQMVEEVGFKEALRVIKESNARAALED